jgi:uncharacterized membrane protein
MYFLQKEMKVKTYQKIKWLLLIVLMAWTVWSIKLESVLLAVVGIIPGMVLLSLLKLRVKGVLVDERQLDVSEKAARTSFQVLMPVLGLASLTLIIGGSGPYYYVRALGIVLSYITCLGLIIYLLFYWYFNRKYGG